MKKIGSKLNIIQYIYKYNLTFLKQKAKWIDKYPRLTVVLELILNNYPMHLFKIKYNFLMNHILLFMFVGKKMYLHVHSRIFYIINTIKCIKYLHLLQLCWLLQRYCMECVFLIIEWMLLNITFKINLNKLISI